MNKLITKTRSLVTNSRLHFSSFTIQRNQIPWSQRLNGVFIKFPLNRSNILFYVHKQMRFKHLAAGMLLQNSEIKYPEGVDAQSSIYEFLHNWQKPQSVQIIFEGQKKSLMNKAYQKDSVLALKTIKNPHSIYGYLNSYLQKNKEQTKSSGDINYFLNHFYLRLTAQTYCLINKVNMANQMSPAVLRNILDFIGEQYENTSPAELKRLHTTIELVKRKIGMVEEQISQLQREGDRIVKLYKYGAIIVTTIHILSFGYMIFFVDWLGWDIMEPLTYTAGVIYVLLGIRFYKKYRADRSYQNIREVLIRATMKPRKYIQKKQIEHRLQLHRKELKRLNCKSRILKNRINFRTSLCDALRGETDF